MQEVHVGITFGEVCEGGEGGYGDVVAGGVGDGGHGAAYGAEVGVGDGTGGKTGYSEGEPLVEAGDVARVENFALSGGFGSDGMPYVICECVLCGWRGVESW